MCGVFIFFHYFWLTTTNWTLCRYFSWPLVSVEFLSLGNTSSDGIVTFLLLFWFSLPCKLFTIHSLLVPGFPVLLLSFPMFAQTHVPRNSLIPIQHFILCCSFLTLSLSHHRIFPVVKDLLSRTNEKYWASASAWRSLQWIFKSWFPLPVDWFGWSHVAVRGLSRCLHDF